MSRRRQLLASILLISISYVSEAKSQSAPDSVPVLTEAERLYGLSLLWQEVNYNFAFFDKVPTLNWDSVYRAYIPRVLKAPSTYDYYRDLQRMIALLNDGHTGVWMPPSLRSEQERRETYPWVVTGEADGRLMIRGVGKSLVQDIPPFSEIIEIDGRPAVQVALERQLPFIAQSAAHMRTSVALTNALQGHVDEPVTITYVTPKGEKKTRTLARDRRTRTDEWTAEVTRVRPPFEFRWLPDGIAYVALNTMADTMTARSFEDSLPALRKARALIVDVRFNGGGNSSVAYRVAQWMTNDTLVTSRWKTREHRAAYKAWGRLGNKKYAEYGDMNAWFEGTHGSVAPAEGERLIKPTVVLQDYQTGSAAEDFLVALDKVPHVTMVGRPSAGTTGQPLMLVLPGGGGARIVTKRDTYPDGREFVGYGAPADVVVARKIPDYQTGRDPQLERAVGILKSK